MKKVLSIVLTGALAASFVMSASAAEVIKIGGIGPTTGPAASTAPTYRTLWRSL